MRTFPLRLAAVTALLTAIAPAAHASDDPVCAPSQPSVEAAPAGFFERCVVVAGGVRSAPGPLSPGDTAYYKTNSPAPLAVRKAPLPTLDFTPVGANARPIYAMAFDWTATTLYGVDNSTRQLGTISQTTGAFTPVALINPDPGAMFDVTGLAFDPASGNVYFSMTDRATANLYRIDLGTAALTLVGAIGGFPYLVDIAIDNGGQMYGHDVDQDVLVRIDKATGAATLVGPTGLAANYAQGMTYDPSDDTLYGCAFVTSPAPQGELVRFDRATGAATVLATAADEVECSVKVARAGLVPLALAVDTAGNGVVEPGETVTVAPGWHNASSLTWSDVTGAFSTFTGPAGGTYSLLDAAAAYGTLEAGADATCTSDCYGLKASATTRPAVHWDARVSETLPAGATRTWTLHIGESFSDVPSTSGYYRFVETLLHEGVTGGCGTDSYCPSTSTTREQMAVFALVSREGAGYAPAACGSPLFSDVPASSPYCRFIEELARRGVVSGCGPNTYCPTALVSREQMSVFMLKTLDPTLDPPACTTPRFDDVPAASPYCKYIEELARRGVVTGCGNNDYCPTGPVTREQMAVFLTATFALHLYGI